MGKRILILILSTLSFLAIVSCNSTTPSKVKKATTTKKRITSKKVNTPEEDKEEIKQLFKNFQKYYLNTWQYQSLLLELFANNDSITIIFPQARIESNLGWAVGKEEIGETFQRAFKYWESFHFYPETLQIYQYGNSACFSIQGIVKLSDKYEENLKYYSQTIYNNIKNKVQTEFNKATLSILYKVLEPLNDKTINGMPFVGSGYLIKLKDSQVGKGTIYKWKFQQMHLSLPVDLRAIKDIRVL